MFMPMSMLSNFLLIMTAIIYELMREFCFTVVLGLKLEVMDKDIRPIMSMLIDVHHDVYDI